MARKYNLDENVFDEIDEEAAYWLGFIAADGSVSKDSSTIRLSIQERDLEHLKEYQNFWNTNRPIYTHDCSDDDSFSDQNMVTLCINSQKVLDILKDYNIVPNKTFSVRISDRIEDNLRHFIRGYFEGDGHVGWRGGHETFYIGVDGNKEMLTDILDAFKERFNTRASVRNRIGCNCYRFQLEGEPAENFLEWIYKDSHVFLGRKWEKYNAYKETNTSIRGVEVKDLTVHSDDRGDLYEMAHKYDMPRFGQVYFVKNPTRGTIRAFHKHQYLWDFFTIVNGRAKFILVDDRKESPTYRKKEEIILDAGNPKMIVVPPGAHHGWQSLTDDTILASVGSDVYDADDPDETRVAWDKFDNWQQTRK
jgi:dTDP-4-dehydrorhamnose 3,5-epimerase-like enzyme